MKEATARTKICPHMTLCVNEYRVSEYNAVPEYDNKNCQASNCMAWRWDDDQHTDGHCGLSGEVVR